ncbi:MAG: ribosome maturation factor RimP [Propionibacteriales bacterium]|nr:ribosome maturation factor RimP [Propionibacteriales bacterium]
MNHDQIAAELTPLLAGFGLELEAIETQPAGRSTLVRLVIDGDGPDGTGPSLDELASATKKVMAALEESGSLDTDRHALELSSRGVHRPLTEEKHWRRNTGRLIKINFTDDAESIIGRITGHSADGATLDVDGQEREVPYADMAKAVVQVEFNRRTTPLDAVETDDETGTDEEN